MNSAMWRYFAINQLLVGADLEKLPQLAKDAIGFDGIRKQWKEVKRIEVPKYDAIESLFLSYLRIEDYGLCVSEQSQHVVPLARVVELVRQDDLDPRQYSMWAASSLASVEETKGSVPRIVDGVLQVPTEYLDSGYDLDGAMRKMFAIRCWGTRKLTSELKELAIYLLNFCEPKGDIVLEKDAFEAVLEYFRAAKVNPLTLSQSVLRVHDLSAVQKLTQSLCWWADETKQAVSIICPRGKGDKLVHAVINTKEYINLCGENFTGAAGVFAQGERLVLEGKTI